MPVAAPGYIFEAARAHVSPFVRPLALLLAFWFKLCGVVFIACPAAVAPGKKLKAQTWKPERVAGSTRWELFSVLDASLGPIRPKTISFSVAVRIYCSVPGVCVSHVFRYVDFEAAARPCSGEVAH